MATKQNRRESDRNPALRHQAARAFVEHPRWSLTGLASLAVIVPAVIYLGGWLGGLVDTPGSAKDREDKLRTEMKAELTANMALVYAELHKLKSDVEARWGLDARTQAGVLLQLLENRAYVTRNKVNDCNIMRQTGKMTALEQAACFQYEADYAEAKRRYEQQQNTASQTWRTQ